MKKRNYRRILFVLLMINFFAIAFFGYRALKESVPDQVQIRKEDKNGLEDIFQKQWITYEDALQVSGSQSYFVNCKFLDILPLKRVKVEVVEDRWVEVSGTPIGLYMETDGVLIIDAGEIIGTDGIPYQPALHIIQGGDYILKVDEEIIYQKRQLIEKIQSSQGEAMHLLVRRKGEEIPISLTPLLAEDNTYKLGIWVRDNTQGIGTLTYVESDGHYGALGHGISDVDTGKLLELGKGELYQAQIMKVVKGTKGAPGELSGMIVYDEVNCMGTIENNSSKGIFGNLEETSRECLSLRPMEVGLKQEVCVGKASMLTTVNGETKEFEIEITDIDWNQADSNKALSIRVTDSALLSYSGGIVQGMSGSPILQNGKLVGAITHVFVQDSTRGYGIFIENMLK